MKGANAQKRRAARERAVQFLFGLDFTRYEWRDAIEEFWLSSPVQKSIKDYTEKLIEGVVEHRDELDASIESQLSNWSPERVGRIEQNVMRVALYEMLHCEDVPKSVAINEAIEIIKKFSSVESTRFVNGVLDKFGEG